MFFIPLGTTRPHWRVPYVTYALIGANILVFALQLAVPNALPEGFLPDRPSFFSWLAALFMHGGLFHLAGNMVFLWLFATLTEDVFGAWLFLAFYFASDIGATLLHWAVGAAFAPNSLATPVVGASGAIAGIMGLSALCFLEAKVRVWYLFGYLLYWRTGIVEIAAPAFVGLWVAWEAVQGVFLTSSAAASAGGGGVAHWAHVGGFAVGFLGAWLLKLRRRVVRTDLVEGRRPTGSIFQAYGQARELENMVRASPDDAEAWHALGRALEISGRRDRAGAAYARALTLFLASHRFVDAVRAYRGMREYHTLPPLPDEQLFRLGCALEEQAHLADAFAVFQQLALGRTLGQYTETALIRAADLARKLPGRDLEAAHCYREYLKAFPDGEWRALALQGLEQIEGVVTRPLPETQPPPTPPRKITDSDLRPLGDPSEPPDQ